MIRAIKFTAALAVVSVIAVAAYTTVFAHADYDHSMPGRDEVVADSPSQVQVFFKQDVVKREGIYYVHVLDDAGTQVSTGDGVVNDDDRTNINAEIPTTLSPGRYIVDWMTTSDIDGDEATGKFCFYVAVQPTAEQEAECASFAPELLPTSTVASAATEAPTAVAGPTATVTTSGNGDSGGSSNTGLIIGIVVGVVAVIVIGGGGYAWMRRRG